jgi:hypothetical protein|tara:strand:+ start:358 stop:681 length:324 start_codon:yes stop_codon:yes gene_type:complete
MSQYGKTIKQICFESNDKLHADLKIRLHYDGLKIKEFFNKTVEAYVEGNENILAFVEELKKEKSISKTKRNKMDKARQKQKETIKQFGLDKDDIENIFDILEKENNL